MEENMFWVSFWKILGLVFVVSLVVTFSFVSNSNSQWYSAWNNCVETGGQPIVKAIEGQNSAALTCVRN